METDAQLIAFALNMYANWIETGNSFMSANNAIKRHELPKALNDDQRALVVRLRCLANKQMTN